MLKIMALLFFVTSCSLFKSGPSLKSQNIEKLLEAVKVTGEGRGRLTLGQSSYLFSVDSVLREDFDWILAVAIPLHGEEVMILPDLRKSQIADQETESFEARIEKEFQRLDLNDKLTSEQFLKELRTLIRFSLAKKLSMTRDCKAQQTEFICELDGEKFNIDVTDKELNINKSLGEQNTLQLVAKNLTDSFFTQTDIRLYSNAKDLQKKDSRFSLELFWKN
jgi:hypothetical protein